MDITFSTRKLQRIFNSDRELKQEYGQCAEKIKARMAVLRAAANLSQVPNQPPDRRHELTGRSKGEFAVDLKHPYRLIFCPNHDPVPLKEDGGFDLHRISAITILRVEDYH